MKLNLLLSSTLPLPLRALLQQTMAIATDFGTTADWPYNSAVRRCKTQQEWQTESQPHHAAAGGFRYSSTLIILTFDRSREYCRGQTGSGEQLRMSPFRYMRPVTKCRDSLDCSVSKCEACGGSAWDRPSRESGAVDTAEETEARHMLLLVKCPRTAHFRSAPL